MDEYYKAWSRRFTFLLLITWVYWMFTILGENSSAQKIWSATAALLVFNTGLQISAIKGARHESSS